MSSPAFDRDMKELVASLQILVSDVRTAYDLSQQRDTPFARRAYVRAVFAMIEGNINLMAGAALAAAARGDIHASKCELEVLRQEREEISVNGVRFTRVKFVPICDRVGPVFHLFARIAPSRFVLDKGGSGWRDFKRAVEIRNRITHPKRADCFAIIDADLTAVEGARSWIASSVERLCNEFELT
jgi:hypothetical protein